jgi:hypothetical protein
MANLAFAWRVLCALNAQKPTHGHVMTMACMAGKQKKLVLARTKAQGWLLLFWVGCVCIMGVLFGQTSTIHHQTTKMRVYLPG